MIAVKIIKLYCLNKVMPFIDSEPGDSLDALRDTQGATRLR